MARDFGELGRRTDIQSVAVREYFGWNRSSRQDLINLAGYITSQIADLPKSLSTHPKEITNSLQKLERSNRQ